MANFEASPYRIKLSKNLLFLKSEELGACCGRTFTKNVIWIAFGRRWPAVNFFKRRQVTEYPKIK